MDESPLGAAALAGTGFPIDRHMTAKALGFREPTRNSIDSVSDRDYALEFLAASAITATHLSRFAEEIVIWSTPQFNFIRLSDSFSTGSSIMPQKKNPDAAELVRAKTGRITGSLVALLDRHEGPAALLFKGHAGGQGSRLRRRRNTRALPRRHDRHGLGHANQHRCHEKGRWRRLCHRHRPRRLAGARPSTSPSARRTTSPGGLWRWPKARRPLWKSWSFLSLQSLHPGITAEVFSVLTVEKSVRSRTSFGGAAPGEVRKQVRYWKKRIVKA